MLLKRRADIHSVEGFGESFALPDTMLCSLLQTSPDSSLWEGAIRSHEDGRASEPLSRQRGHGPCYRLFAGASSGGSDFAPTPRTAHAERPQGSAQGSDGARRQHVLQAQHGATVKQLRNALHVAPQQRYV